MQNPQSVILKKSMYVPATTVEKLWVKFWCCRRKGRGGGNEMYVRKVPGFSDLDNNQD